MLRHLWIFLILQGVLFTVEILPPVQTHVVLPWTETLAEVSGRLIRVFDDQVHTFGVMIQSTANGFTVAIRAGCNGVEAMILLLAAMLAFPAPWRYKLIGLVVGGLSVQLLNILRIITLFYLGQWDKEVFEWAHLYVWQALIMLDVVIVFLLWLRLLPAKPREDTAVPPLKSMLK